MPERETKPPAARSAVERAQDAVRAAIHNVWVDHRCPRVAVPQKGSHGTPHRRLGRGTRRHGVRRGPRVSAGFDREFHAANIGRSPGSLRDSSAVERKPAQGRARLNECSLITLYDGDRPPTCGLTSAWKRAVRRANRCWADRATARCQERSHHNHSEPRRATQATRDPQLSEH